MGGDDVSGCGVFSIYFARMVREWRSFPDRIKNANVPQNTIVDIRKEIYQVCIRRQQKLTVDLTTD